MVRSERKKGRGEKKEIASRREKEETAFFFLLLSRLRTPEGGRKKGQGAAKGKKTLSFF